MCLIFFAYRRHHAHRLILAANRDEFYHRPAAPMAYWEDLPDVLAGRDLSAGGTWLGIHRNGRWAALTNYRDPAAHRSDARSRGGLIRDFLAGNAASMAYLSGVAAAAPAYNGFNLLVDDGRCLAYLGSTTGRPHPLPPGVYGLSNHLLNTPWPKVSRGKHRFWELLTAPTVSVEDMMVLLSDRQAPPDATLPDTGVGLAWERLLGTIFIASPGYGTRCSTVLLVGNDGAVEVTERTYRVTDGDVTGSDDRRFRFQTAAEDR